MTPHLSTIATRATFQIPNGALGDIVCTFPLAWMWNMRDNFVQPLIQTAGLYTPGFRPATPAEIATYSPTPYKDRDNYKAII